METATETTPESVPDADVQAAFAGGFSGQPTEATPPAEPEAPQLDALPDPPAPKFVQITEEQFAALNEAATKVPALAATLEKMSGTAFGKIGGLERTLRQLQEATPQGHAVSVSEEDFEEMKADFPELLGMTVKGLNRALGKVRGTAPAFDETKIAELVGTRTKEVREALSMELMDTLDEEYRDSKAPADYPGWIAVATSEPYRAWMIQQPQEYQDTINNSWKPREILGSIKKFHQFTEAQAKAAPPKDDPGAVRRRRMEQAVQPRGEGAVTPGDASELDAFRSGFKKEFQG